MGVKICAYCLKEAHHELCPFTYIKTEPSRLLAFEAYGIDVATSDWVDAVFMQWAGVLASSPTKRMLLSMFTWLFKGQLLFLKVIFLESCVLQHQYHDSRITQALNTR